MRVELCKDGKIWDSHVESAPGSSHSHLWNWKQVIEDTYGHSTYYLMAVDNGAIRGVLPLARIRSWLFGNFMVSLPFMSYGGVLASDVDAQAQLAAKAVELAREFGDRHIELRQGDTWEGGWVGVSVKVAMIVPLPPTKEDLWRSLSGRLRNKVRTAQKQGLIGRWQGSSAISDFYQVFATNMRNLGTPVYPRRWFENICRLFPHQSRVLTLYEGSCPVASTFVTCFGDTVELPWIASVPQARRFYSTALLYWTALKWAVENGYRRVDLGRCTPGSGVYQFKRQWQCIEKPLHWYYWLAPGASVPHMRPDNPRFRLAIKAWRRLPLWLANSLGPRIVRSIP
jgi:serine/alanine adding enzyme